MKFPRQSDTRSPFSEVPPTYMPCPRFRCGSAPPPSPDDPESAPRTAGYGISIKAQARVLHIMDNLRVTDDDAQTAGRQGEQLGKGTQYHYIFIFQGMLDKGIRVEIMISLVHNNDCAHFFRPAITCRAPPRCTHFLPGCWGSEVLQYGYCR